MAGGQRPRGRRRAPGEGSIQRFAGGKYRVRLRWQRQERQWIVATRSEAVAKLREAVRQRDEGRPLYAMASLLTVDRWMDEWLEAVALGRPRTLDAYTSKLAHLRPLLGAYRLADLDAAAIRHALVDLNRSLSPTMLHHVHRTLHTCLAAAVKEGKLVRNPADAIITPARSRFEARTLTAEEAARLVEACHDSWLGPLVTMALATGMRRGELLALTWNDVDFQTGEITVNKTADRMRHDVANPPKTPSARRTVQVDPSIFAVLEEQRSRVAARRLSARVWVDHGLIFPNSRGGYLTASGHFRKEYRALLSRARCPVIRFHDLRHTAGLFLTRSVGLVVTSRILGHASPSITAALYGHADHSDYAVAARGIARSLGLSDGVCQTPSPVLRSGV